MKYILIVPDGMADLPIEELGGKTPLQVARTTNMDYLAQNGMTGLVQTIPDNMNPGSDIGNLALLGYDPSKNYSGRAPLEAANLGIELTAQEIAFRCNLITVADDKMFDYSAGHISTPEAEKLILTINEKLGRENIRFYAGKSYRHLLVMKIDPIEDYLKIKTIPPHDILGKDLKDYLPQGKGQEILLDLMQRSQQILKNHEINQVRIDLKENPANMIWLWGQGIQPELPTFQEKYGLQGAIISAVDLVNGIGRLIGLEIVQVPNITGYYDTNYQGKADYALKALKKNDFVYIHIEAPDEAGHNGDLKAKIECIEKIDQYIVGTIINYFDKNDDVRILLVPDHPTPVKLRTHTRDPVCYVMQGKGIPKDGSTEYNEHSVQDNHRKFSSGKELVDFFIRGNMS